MIAKCEIGSVSIEIDWNVEDGANLPGAKKTF